MAVTERLAAEDALQRVQNALGSSITNARVVHGAVHLDCEPTKLVEVMTQLRDGDGLQYRFFSFLSAIDWSEFGQEETKPAHDLEVLVQVYAPEHAVHANVHVPVEMGGQCPTITGVYRGAFWHERECHEMFNIDFEGHPRLVNLYLPEDFEGHPGLRSFKLPSRTVVKDWPGAKDPEEAAAGGK